MDIPKIARAAAMRCANDNNNWYGYDHTAEVIAEAITEALQPKPTDRFEIIPQQQPDSNTCGQTCIAMLLGIPAADVVGVFGGRGMSRRDIYHAMERCRFWWNALLFEYTMLHGHYIAVVPSLNFEAEGHYVIIRRDEDGETVFDPNRGRGGKKFYGEGGVPVKMRESMIYVCKKGWCGNWYNGHLPAVQAVALEGP